MKHFLLLSILLGSFFSWSQVVMSGSGSYSQNFNSLITTGSGTWTDNSTIASWYGQRSGTGTNIIAGDGSSNTGALYSFGTGTDADRAFSGLGSGTPGNFAIGAQFHNTSGGNLTTFTVSYTMEQWRNGGNTTAQTLTFWYQVSSSPITALTPNNSTGWTAVTALDATSPIATATAAPLDGNQTANKVVHTNIVIPGLVLAAGQYLMIKWDDPNNTGNDHGLGIDDFSMSWSGSCNTFSSINASACSSYTVPSGDEQYFASGIYHDTIPNAAMCDSIITINLTITGGTTSSFSVTACTSYTVPSGDEQYFASGVYNDTIPNHLGCDSVMTITVNIVTGITYYQDFDTDGLGNPAVTMVGCTQPGGYVANANDCNDNNSGIGAATIWYADADNDTYGNPAVTATNCVQPMGYVANNTDCNDNLSSVHPGATEIPNNGVDEDCNGSDLIITPTPLAMYEFTGNDCAGANLNVTAQPANATFGAYAMTSGTVTCAVASNVINASGWNTSANIDLTEYYSFSVTPASCYEMDLTELRFTHRNSGTGGTPTIHMRSSLDGFAADFATVAINTANSLENEIVALPAQFMNVTSSLEIRFYVTSMAASTATYRHDDVSLIGNLNSLPVLTYYVDADGDGFGDAATSITNCVPPVGYVANNTDCDDTDEDEYPGATWVIDNDNDGFAGATTQTSCTRPVGYIPTGAPSDCDDNNNTITGQTAYYEDFDNDTYGDNGSMMMACSQPVGYVTNNLDCDDNDALVGAAAFTFYADTDADGYGDPNSSVPGCAVTPGYVANDDDCDDSNPAIYPGAAEICDNEDNNCDGNIDEGVPTFTFYEDADNDGLGDAGSTIQDCSQPTGYVGNDDDCDDTDPSPNAGEILYYADVDMDGFGDPFETISTCTAPTGYVVVGGDCNDNNNAINPDATDAEGDGIDQNCDGVDGNLSIAEDLFFEISASPNPGTVFVMVSVSENFGLTTTEFITADGKVLNLPFAMVEGGIEVQTANLVPGIYIIRLSNGDSYTTTRWIKQ